MRAAPIGPGCRGRPRCEAQPTNQAPGGCMHHSIRRALSVLGLTLLPGAAMAQQSITISGLVTAEGDIPLFGVSVSLPELGLGATTKEDGRYSIFIPGARVLGQTVTMQVRRVGYNPKTAKVTLSG